MIRVFNLRITMRDDGSLSDARFVNAIYGSLESVVDQARDPGLPRQGKGECAQFDTRLEWRTTTEDSTQ